MAIQTIKVSFFSSLTTPRTTNEVPDPDDPVSIELKMGRRWMMKRKTVTKMIRTHHPAGSRDVDAGAARDDAQDAQRGGGVAKNDIDVITRTCVIRTTLTQ